MKMLLLIITIFTIPYVYNLNKSNNIKMQIYKDCREQNKNNCDLIDKYHQQCFEKSYRLVFRSKEFFQTEYNICMQKYFLP